MAYYGISFLVGGNIKRICWDLLIKEYSIKMSKNENISAEVLAKISKSLGYTIDDLIEYEDE